MKLISPNEVNNIKKVLVTTMFNGRKKLINKEKNKINDAPLI